MEQSSPTTPVFNIVREHVWVYKPIKEPTQTWEERHCPECDLKDERRHDISERDRGRTHHGNWQVTTPCIEPVPSSVDYATLEVELKAHDVREYVQAIGRPGAWIIGFGLGGSGEYNVYPLIEAKDLDHGFALLLRWMRVRQYNVDRYSNFSYARGLANSTCCGDDDD